MYYTKKDIADFLTLPIESAAIALGLDVVRHCCPCPRHLDRNPSMHFYANTNRFFCFSCRQSGNAIDLVKLVLNVGFVDACNWLDSVRGERDGSGFRGVHDANGNRPTRVQKFDASKYVRYFEHPFLNEKASAFLFEERKLNPSVIERLRLSSWRDTLQIPYFDITGLLIGVQFRNLGSSGPRFKFPSGSQCHIYNLPILRHLKDGEELYIAEGCSDCWSLLSSGHKAIAIPSATTLNQSTLQQLSIINSQLSIKWNMFPDNDIPGENLYLQLSKSLPIIRHSLPTDCKDYSELWCKSNAMPSLLEYC